MRFLKKTSLIAVAIILWMGCAKEIYVDPEKPDMSGLSYVDIPTSHKTVSTVNLPVTIPMQTVRSKINQMVPPRLNIAEWIPCPETPLPKEERCLLSGHIDFSKPSFSGSDQTLTAGVNISGHIKLDIWYRIDFGIGSKGKHMDKNLHFAGNVGLTSKPTIDYNWSLVPNATGTVNYSKAYVHFGPKISVRGKLKEKTEPMLNKKLDELERKIYNSTNLKSQLQPMWKDLAKPIKISEEHSLWMTIQPIELRYNEINVTNDTLKMGVGMDLEMVTYMGEEPAKLDLGDIPNLVKAVDHPNQFSLNLPVLLSYEQLGNSINNELKDKWISVSKKVDVLFKNVALASDENQTLIQVGFEAKRKKKTAKGTIYLNATPEFSNGSVAFKNIDFDLKTRSFLLNAAEWLLKPTLTKKLQDKASYNLNAALDSARCKYNKQFAQISNDDYEINSVLHEALLSDIVWSEKGIYILGQANGEVDATVKSLNLD